MRCLCYTTLLVLVLVANAHAQSDTPLPQDPWIERVQQFSHVLTDGDPAALVGMLAQDAAYQAFNAQAADAVHLLARTRKGTILFAQGYSHTPQSLAGDIANSIRDAQFPDPLKRNLIPQNEAHTARANATAEQWVHNRLEPKSGDPVGVILIWCQPTENPPAAQTPSELIFVLVKGDSDPANLRLRTIIFGDPRPKTE